MDFLSMFAALGFFPPHSLRKNSWTGIDVKSIPSSSLLSTLTVFVLFPSLACEDDLLFKPRSRRLGGFFALPSEFLVLSVSRPKLPLGHCCHQMMSSSANYRPFLSSFRHIPPSGAFCQVRKLTIQTEHGRL